MSTGPYWSCGNLRSGTHVLHSPYRIALPKRPRTCRTRPRAARRHFLEREAVLPGPRGVGAPSITTEVSRWPAACSARAARTPGRLSRHSRACRPPGSLNAACRQRPTHPVSGWRRRPAERERRAPVASAAVMCLHGLTSGCIACYFKLPCFQCLRRCQAQQPEAVLSAGVSCWSWYSLSVSQDLPYGGIRAPQTWWPA